jgi:hypothetical protein
MNRRNIPTATLRIYLYLLVLIALSQNSLKAQTPVERPEVHAEFGFGVLPWSSEAVESLASEDVRTLISGLHRGWSVDKFIDETEQPRLRILTIMDDLETARLVRGRTDFDMRPGFPVLRELDLIEIDPVLERTTGEFLQIIEDHWDELETFCRSLDAGQEFPELQNMYRLVIGGVLLGGMIDVLFDDQTLMPGAPRRARRGEEYYAWMVEGEQNRSYMVRQTARVGRHQVFSVGPVAEENLRIQIDVLAQEGPVYETEDARRWRVFTRVFSRDYLLPYIKAQRSQFLELHSNIEASRYSALAEFVAWYYQELVHRTADSLVASGRIEAPGTSYKYALREPR